DLRAAHDEHVGAARRDRLRERLVLQIRLVDDIAAGRLQSLDAALLELVGDQDLHIVWTSRPSRSFGSNHVDFGGMMPPSSAIDIRSSMVTGCMEKATAARPSLTADSSAAVPRAPPTKSIRLSLRMSPILRSGSSTWCCRRATSRPLAREPSAGAAFDRSSAYHAPSRYIDTSPMPPSLAV